MRTPFHMHMYIHVHAASLHCTLHPLEQNQYSTWTVYTCHRELDTCISLFETLALCCLVSIWFEYSQLSCLGSSFGRVSACDTEARGFESCLRENAFFEKLLLWILICFCFCVVIYTMHAHTCSGKQASQSRGVWWRERTSQAFLSWSRPRLESSTSQKNEERTVVLIISVMYFMYMYMYMSVQLTWNLNPSR